MIRKNVKKEKFKMFILITILIIIVLMIFLPTKKIIGKVNENSVNSVNVIEIANTNENMNSTNTNIENKLDKPNEPILNNQENNNTITNENNEKKEDTEKDIYKNNREFGSNVAFIGNSRTQAFLMYAGLKDVVDYTNIGLMVDTAITKKFVTNDKGEKITILEDLKNKNIDTVYIMLGINELGWVYSSIFIQKYEELIDKIKQIKPNCEIIVQSIIPVTKTKSDNDDIYNNRKITEYNTLIKEMTDRKGIKFIDLVPVLADENGNLPENASPDDVHLNKAYCLKWLECLKNN